MTAERQKRSIGRWIPYSFPFLISVTTVTALAAHNPQAGITTEDLILPLGIALAITIIAWFIACFLVRTRERRSFVTLALALPALSSAYFFRLVPQGVVPAGLTSELQLALTVLVMAAGAIVGGRAGWCGESAARFCSWGALFLFVLTFPVHLIVGEAPSRPRSRQPMVLTDSISPRPDIYFLVLDGYSGAESLFRVYGFDDTPFLDSLRARGFRIPEQLKSNYILTFLSVGSMLNREYEDSIARASAPRYQDLRAAFAELEFNRTVRDLKSAGYRFVYFGSSYPRMAGNGLADNDDGRKPAAGYLASVWLSTSVIAPLYSTYCAHARCEPQRAPFRTEKAADTQAEIGRLASEIISPGPKFVYAHLLLPHEPYRFGPACEPRQPRWTEGNHPERDTVLTRLYLDQVRCTNRLMLRLVGTIQAVSPDAVILLQADHGNGRFHLGQPPPLADAEPAQIKERFDPFAAYAGPGSLPDSLAAQTSLVNIFRTAFRVLWGVNEPSLPDRHYWSTWKQPLAFTEVPADGISWEEEPHDAIRSPHAILPSPGRD